MALKELFFDIRSNSPLRGDAEAQVKNLKWHNGKTFSTSFFATTFPLGCGDGDS